MRTAGVDLVVLQDGSASMHVTDVKPDRWQRSTKFLRVVAESLQWTNDRIALALQGWRWWTHSAPLVRASPPVAHTASARRPPAPAALSS